MFNPTQDPNPSFHYIYPSSPSPYYLLLLDITQTLEALEACKTRLLNTPFSASDGEFIRAVECDQALEISREIRETAKRLEGKMARVGNLQGLPGNTYYTLNMYLYSAGEKTQKLETLLKNFRSICGQQTSQQRNVFASVQEAIWMCMKVCEQVQQETESVLDVILMNTESFSDLPTASD